MPFNKAERHMDVCIDLYRNIENHTIYDTYQSTSSFVSGGLRLVMHQDSIAVLMSRYQGIKYYRDWLVEQTARKIEKGLIEKNVKKKIYDQNIISGMQADGGHPKPVGVETPISQAGLDSLVIAIKARAASIETEKLDKAVDSFQDYVGAEMSRAYGGAYGDDQLNQIQVNYDFHAEMKLGAYGKDFKVDDFRNILLTEFTENKEKIDLKQEEGIKKILTKDGIDNVAFWSNLPSIFNILTSQEADKVKIEEAIMQATVDPVEYALNQLRNDPNIAVELEISEKQCVLEGKGSQDNAVIFLPKDVMRIPFHLQEEEIKKLVKSYIEAIIATCSGSEKFYKAKTKGGLDGLIQGYSEDVQGFIWKKWSTLQYTNVIKNIKIKLPKAQAQTYEAMGEVIFSLYNQIAELGLHVSIHETAAKEWLTSNEVTELPDKGDTGVIQVAAFLLTERYVDVCKSKGLQGKATAIAKLSPLLATIRGIVTTIKGSKDKLDKALESEGNGSNEALEATGKSFENILKVGSVFGEFALALTGLNLASAIAAIPGFAKEAYNAIKLRTAAKADLVTAENSLKKVMEKINRGEVSPENLKEKGSLETKIFALGVVLTKKLRQFIWDIVEILKRILSICSTIFKLTGIAAVAGFSLDIIKTAINAIQQSYFLGRAIYKKYHGTKGVDRHAAADKFIVDAFDTEQLYAAEIIIKTGANKGVINSHLSDMRDARGFIQQIKEMKSNEQLALQSCRSAININLFKALSSKPQASLTRLLFPGSGFIKSMTS